MALVNSLAIFGLLKNSTPHRLKQIRLWTRYVGRGITGEVGQRETKTREIEGPGTKLTRDLRPQRLGEDRVDTMQTSRQIFRPGMHGRYRVQLGDKTSEAGQDRKFWISPLFAWGIETHKPHMSELNRMRKMARRRRPSTDFDFRRGEKGSQIPRQIGPS